LLMLEKIEQLAGSNNEEYMDLKKAIEEY